MTAIESLTVKKEAGLFLRLTCGDHPAVRYTLTRYFPFTTQQQLTQTGHDLGQREGLVKSVVLCDSDTLAAWTGEGSNLLTVHGSEDVLVPVDRIQERNLATITLV